MFRTDDAAELSALHKTIMEAKFSINPVNEEIAGSPVVADLSNRVYDALCKAQEKKKRGSEAEWQEWRRIRSESGAYRGFWRTAIINARGDRLFAAASRDEKLIMAKCYLSPFTCKESEIEEFVSEVENGAADKSLKKLTESVNIKGSSLMKLEYLNEDTVHLALWLVSRKTCDIFFTGIKKFSVTASGQHSLMPAELGKYSVSSSNGESFSGSFSIEGSKKNVEICAENVDYWV